VCGGGYTYRSTNSNDGTVRRDLVGGSVSLALVTREVDDLCLGRSGLWLQTMLICGDVHRTDFGLEDGSKLCSYELKVRGSPSMGNLGRQIREIEDDGNPEDDAQSNRGRGPTWYV
jgi:hypothetical protein